MIAKQDFCRWFNGSFWNAFKKLSIPINIPTDRKQLIEQVFQSIVSARYAPSIPEAEIVMNKGNGVTRTVPVFCVQDYCVYYFCIKELEDVLCVNRTPNTFGGWSLGGRLRQQEHSEIESESTAYGRYSFNPMAWIQAFGEFNSILFSQLDGDKYTHALQFDLSNFYDCVRLDILERWIREESDSEKGWIVTLLFYFLNHWNRRNTGLHPQAVGLPQDAMADCSRILANYYLQKYDSFANDLCESKNSLYLRYADDQIILTNDPNHAEILLLLLTKNLDRYGLRVNQKKVDLGTAKELQENRCRPLQAIFAQRGDNQNPALVKKFVENYISMPEDQLTKSWNSGLPLLNRLVYSNLESLTEPLFGRLVDRFIAKSYLERADHRKLKRVECLAKRSGRSEQFREQLDLLLENSVHNAFHYEVRAFAINQKKADLITQCDLRLNAIEHLMNQLN